MKCPVLIEQSTSFTGSCLPQESPMCKDMFNIRLLCPRSMSDVQKLNEPSHTTPADLFHESWAEPGENYLNYNRFSLDVLGAWSPSNVTITTHNSNTASCGSSTRGDQFSKCACNQCWSSSTRINEYRNHSQRCFVTVPM